MTAPRLADLGAPVATGRTSEVYALPGRADRVLKLFLAGVPAAQAEEECARTRIAADAGVTGVRCHGTVAVGGRWGLELDRLDGVSLNRVVERNPLVVRRTARTLARIQAQMHDVRAPGLPGVREAVLDTLDAPATAFLSPAERDRARSLVGALPDGDRLLHLDFHPENVFTASGGYAVIDWATALRGSPAADAAMSVLIIAEAELWPGTPALKRALVTVLRRTYLDAYSAEYRRLSGLTAGDVARWRLPALVLRLGWGIDSERDRLRAQVHPLLAPGVPAAAGGRDGQTP